VYCVYLLAAGGGIAYAGSSGRVKERLNRHFRGYSSAAGRGLRPGAAYVLACTRSRSLALAWEAWLHKAYRPPYAARAPAKRPRKPPHPPPGWYIPRAAVYEPARLPPPPGREEHERPTSPPPEVRPSAKTWDGVRDGGPSAQEASAESAPRVLSRRIRIRIVAQAVRRRGAVSPHCGGFGGAAALNMLRRAMYVIRPRSYVYLSVFNLVHFST
jgi:predicted GIY-YIG superfamily endonuclease